jgi:hypothetical protein
MQTNFEQAYETDQIEENEILSKKYYYYFGSAIIILLGAFYFISSTIENKRVAIY